MELSFQAVFVWLFFFFGTTTAVGQGLPVPPIVKWAWLSVTYCYHTRIVGTWTHEPMTGMLLRRTSWRLYHQTGSYD